MSKNVKFQRVMLVGLSLLLAACKSSQAEPIATITQLDPNAIYTAAARTANAKMTEIAAITPTPLPPTSTDTPAPPTLTSTPTEIPPSPTFTLPVAPGTPADKAEFVADVTVADGTEYQSGEAFIKTWRVKNAGTATWTMAYSLVFDSGAQMAGPASVLLPLDVAPGQTVDISVNLIAPSDPGNYFGFWKLRNSNNQDFGVGPDSDQPVYVEINVVVSETPTVTSTLVLTGTLESGTPTVTPTPTTAGHVVTDVAISVGNAFVEGACPYTFTFSAQFTTNETAEVTYRLEAEAIEAGYEITLPDPTTATLDEGTHILNYTLEFTTSLDGWAQLHVTTPDDVVSNRVTFSLICE